MLKAQLGTLAISVGFAAAVGGVAVLAVALRRGDRRLLRVGRHAALYVFAAALAAAFSAPIASSRRSSASSERSSW